jgi:elongation factor 1-beta
MSLSKALVALLIKLSNSNISIVLSVALNANSSTRHTPSQADVKTFQALKSKPAAENYPYAYRWYKHIATFESEFSSLPGDPSKEYTAYGPEVSVLPISTKAPEKEAAAEEDDDEVDLFGSDDDEEESAEAAKLREERLAEYNKKKAGKVKPAAKSIVTMDVKPWGMFSYLHPSQS